MSNTLIDAAFRAKLRDVLGAGASIAFENTKVENRTRPYYKATLLPGETQTPTFGTDGLQRYVGVYQISIVVDAGSGVAAISTLVDQLINSFTRGLTLTNGGVIINVEKAWRSPAIPGVDVYTIPVSVRYWSDTI